MSIADDNAAPDDPATMVRNLWANAGPYIFLLYPGRVEDGAPELTLAGTLADVRKGARLALKEARRGQQYRVIDTNTKPERWFDPSLDPDEQGRWPAGWNGAMAVALRFEGGLGDKL